MISGLIFLIVVIFFVIVLIVISSIQTRLTGLHLLIRTLQKRVDELQKNEKTPTLENNTDTTVLKQPTPSTTQRIINTIDVVAPKNDVISTEQVIQPQRQTPPQQKLVSKPDIITQNQRQKMPALPIEKTNESDLGKRFISWLIKGNPVAKVAIIILFFGLSYLLKYSIDNGLLSPEIRILGSLSLGFILLGLGWKLRLKKTLYALILQGGAIGVLYFTLFAAFKLYDLVPLLLTFALLIVVCATSIMFAVLQRAISLAIMACVGGYLAPILLSTGGGNHIALFSYYLLISSAILIISFWQSWRVLNLIGFAFTFVVAILWGGNSFKSEFYLECQIFILANMLIYGVLAVLLSVRNTKKEPYQHAFDLILLFSVPLMAFCLQYAITRHWEFAPAFSALGFGLFYLIGSFIALRIWRSDAKQLTLYGLAIGLGFSTLAVPLALTAHWTTLVWLFEGTAITIVALSQRQIRFAFIGTSIVMLGILSCLLASQLNQSDTAFVTLFGIVSAILLFNACIWHHHQKINTASEPLKYLFLIISIMVWTSWIIGGTYRLFDNVAYAVQPIIACYVIAVWIWFAIGRKINWPILRYSIIALWPILLLALAHNSLFNLHTFYAGIWGVSWFAAFISGYTYLYFDRQNLAQSPKLLPVLHVSLLWILFAWLLHEVTWALSFLPWGFGVVSWSVSTTIASMIILLFFVLQRYRLFPIVDLKPLYWKLGLLPVGIYLLFNLFTGLYSSGQIIYWTYIPFINPLEEAAALALIALAMWLNNVIKSIPSNSDMVSKQNLSIYTLILIITLVCLWGNSIILRSLSQWLNVSWSFYALWHSSIVQIVLSLVWTLTAVILVAIANHFSIRKAWFAGAVLQGIVVTKLILVDSVELDGLMKAFAFIGVALLMLVIGYLAPLPPKIALNKQSDDNTNKPVVGE